MADEATGDEFVLFWEAMALLVGSFILLLGVRLKSLLFCLPCTVAFMVILPVVIINGYYQRIHILEQSRFTLFLGGDGILDPIWEPLVIVVA